MEPKILEAEERLARGQGDRVTTLEELAAYYERLGDVEAAIDNLQSAWLETGDIEYSIQLRRLRDLGEA